MQEIERKFLISEEIFNQYTKNHPCQLINDIYLFETVRLRRIYENKTVRYILTRKSEDTLVREEEEINLPSNRFLREIFKESICLTKQRFKILLDNKIYEFNKFLNLDQPLFIVEIELTDPTEGIIKLGKEITEDRGYYGYQLWNKIQLMEN